MADGNQFSGIQAARRSAGRNAGAERRGPMRPARLVAARARVSGHALAHAFMAGDAAFLAATALIRATFGHGAWPQAAAGAGMVMLMLLAVGAYDLRRREEQMRHLASVFGAACAGLAAPVALASLAAPLRSDGAALPWAAAVVAGVTGLHLVWFLIVARLRRLGRLSPNIVIIGATPAAERLIRWALATKGAVNVIGVFDDRRGRAGPDVAGVPILGGSADLAEHRILPYVDRIIVTVPSKAGARIAQITDLLGAVPNPITLLMEDAEAEDERASIEHIADFRLRQIAGSRRSVASRVLKRAFDLVVSLVALVAVAPVMAAIALAVRLDSAGPALFRQTRHGYLNEEFRVFKFRSMRVEAEDAQARRQVTAGDDRVTRIGRFIRNTSLDELPQLFNVIRGEMSLVGPRPHAIGMLVQGEEAHRLLKTYAHRHRIKPGLTGWAAVQGSRGPVDSPQEVRRRVALDLAYIERQSFWFDLKIMLRTVPCLLGDRSAVR
jgi:Undecaprenyl-phosphate glucose phosphotransferase